MSRISDVAPRFISSQIPLAFFISLCLALGLVTLSRPLRVDALLFDYYVSTTGTDFGSCPPTAPCRTITYALSQALPAKSISVGPGIYTENITITQNVSIYGGGNGYTIIDGGGIWRVLTVMGTASASLRALTIRNGHMVSTFFGGNGAGIMNYGTLDLYNVDVVSNTVSVPGSCTNYCGGGGIANSATLTMTNGTVGWNQGQSGGGVVNWGTINMSGTVIANNSSTEGSGYGAGLLSVDGRVAVTNTTIRSNNASQSGGGIVNYGPMTITNSTINNNTAWTSAGIYNVAPSGVMTMTNSTVSSNSSSQYGGIAAIVSATIVLNNVTVANNQSPYANGVYVDNSSSLSIYNSILANPGLNCSAPGTGAVSHGHNLISDTSCPSVFTQPGDITNTDPLLSPLTNWGGPTQTHGLYPGSPAIDAGRPFFFMSPYNCDNADQRGVVRLLNYCDIGAFEGVLSVSDLPLIYRY